jgi:hypothetical protein
VELQLVPWVELHVFILLSPTLSVALCAPLFTVMLAVGLYSVHCVLTPPVVLLHHH